MVVSDSVGMRISFNYAKLLFIRCDEVLYLICSRVIGVTWKEKIRNLRGTI